MPPVKPKDAAVALRNFFAATTTLIDFFADVEEGKPMVEAMHSATKRLKKRTGGKKSKKKKIVQKTRPEVIEAEVIDVEGKVVQ